MKLSKESEDAFRQCLRILAPRRTPEQKLIQIRTAETYIQKGKWIPAISVADIALLFYPRDSVRESAMLAQMQQAIEAKELILVAAARGVVLPGDLAAWPDCPQVPTDSPLRYWLPEWMQNTTEVMDTAPVQNTATPAPVVAAVEWVTQAQARAREIVRESKEHDRYPSQENLGDTIAAEFRKAGIVGTDGKPLTGATIKRHALKGISSATGKQLSTTIGRGK